MEYDSLLARLASSFCTKLHMEMNLMNTLPTYLPFSHTQRIFFHFSLFVALIIVTLLDYMLCLARQAYLGTSLYLTKHYCYTS